MRITHNQIIKVNGTANIQVFKLHLAQTGEFQEKSNRASVAQTVYRWERKAVIRFKLVGINYVCDSDCTLVKDFGIGIISDILLVHVPHIVYK